MNDDNDVMLVTERFERRLAEESGKLRVEMSNGFGAVRTDIATSKTDLLKWMLFFWAAQTAALGTLIELLK